MEISENHQSAYPAAVLSNSMLSSFYSLQTQNNLPIIGSNGNSSFRYYYTFGHYLLIPIPLPHSTQIPLPASNFQPLVLLPTTRAFAPLAPSAILPTDPPALSYMDSSLPINSTLPSFAVRQEQQNTWYIAVTNFRSNKSRGQRRKRAQGGRRSISTRAITPSSDFHSSQQTLISIL